MAKRSLGKRVLHSPATHWLLSLLMSLIMRLVYATCKVEHYIAPEAEPYLSSDQPAVFCFWHGRLIMEPFLKPRRRPMYVLISQHNDGALITATMRWFGIDSVRGSRKLGGAQAVRTMLTITERGGNISITPDGPRGPFQKAAEGAAFVAAKTGYPLLPISFSASRHWRFRSWDKFMMPKPFSRLVYVVAAPFSVTADTQEGLNAATAQLEQSLNAATAEADEQCGVAA